MDVKSTGMCIERTYIYMYIIVIWLKDVASFTSHFRAGAIKELVRVASCMVAAGIVPSPNELMQLRTRYSFMYSWRPSFNIMADLVVALVFALIRLLENGHDMAWDEVKQMCMKADTTSLWAVKDAQFRIDVCRTRVDHLQLNLNSLSSFFLCFC